VQQFAQEVLRLVTDTLPDFSGVVKIPFAAEVFHLIKNIFVRSSKGWSAAQQDVEDDTNAPEVALFRVVVA